MNYFGKLSLNMEWSLHIKPSQNHRKFEPGSISGWHPAQSLNHSHALSFVHTQVAFEDFHNPSLQFMPVLCHLHSKKCFLMFRQKRLRSGLHPLPLVLTLSPTEKSSDPSSLQSSFRYWFTLIRPSWAFSFYFWAFPSQLSQPPPFHIRYSSPLAILFVFFWIGSNMSRFLQN